MQGKASDQTPRGPRLCTPNTNPDGRADLALSGPAQPFPTRRAAPDLCLSPLCDYSCRVPACGTGRV